MWALVYDDSTKQVAVDENWPQPKPGPGEALVRVLRAAVCSTDIEITRGYVPGYRQPLGHEFVGVVERCESNPALIGKRVVGEINCNDAGFSCADAIYQRNHAPGRTVLGIIGRAGALAEYLTMPAANFHIVPDELTDAEATFCEPLAAACRIVEQGLVLRAGGNSGGDGCSSSGVGAGNNNSSSNNAGQEAPQKIAVLGDGKLGLLCAQVLALEAGPGRVTLFGRHEEKMALVDGVSERVVVLKDSAEGLAKLHADYGGAFDLVVEATGASGGVTTALALTRPMGTVVLKSTVSLADKTQPQWAALANDIVVAEKKIVGSRCGPMDTALSLMARHAPLRRLLNAMLSEQLPARSRGGEAVALASVKGTLKVQVVF